MFISPDNKGAGEGIDLDFTKPGAIEGIEVHEDHSTIEEKMRELKEKIAATNRGIELAQSLRDEGRIGQMKQKKEEFEATLAMLTPSEPTKPTDTVDIQDYLSAEDRKFDRKTLGS